MPDARFYLTGEPVAVAEALRIAGAAAAASPARDLVVIRAANIDEADIEGAAVFVEDAARAEKLRGRRFGLCFAPAELASALDGAAGVVATVKSPRAAFAAIASLLHAPRTIEDQTSAPRIGDGATIHPTAIIGAGAIIGARVEIGPRTVIGPGVVIGEGSSIAENASVSFALLGRDVKICAGSIVGGPGFGFTAGPEGLQRVPQLGRVLIGDQVEIGANTCVDRGALSDTMIGAGTKIDNLVQIAHNVRIGDYCVIAAIAGIAGSTVIGDRVLIGGHAGIADHLTIGDDARIAAKAGVMSDVPAGETWGGYPARPRMTWLRQTAAMARAAERKKKKATDHDDD